MYVRLLLSSPKLIWLFQVLIDDSDRSTAERDNKPISSVFDKSTLRGEKKTPGIFEAESTLLGGGRRKKDKFNSESDINNSISSVSAKKGRFIYHLLFNQQHLGFRPSTRWKVDKG